MVFKYALNKLLENHYCHNAYDCVSPVGVALRMPGNFSGSKDDAADEKNSFSSLEKSVKIVIFRVYLLREMILE